MTRRAAAFPCFFFLLVTLPPAAADAQSAFETLHQNLGSMSGQLGALKHGGQADTVTGELSFNDNDTSTYGEDDNDSSEPVPYPDIPTTGGSKVDPSGDVDVDDEPVGEGGTTKDTSDQTGSRSKPSPRRSPDVSMEGNGPLVGFPSPR